MKKWTFAVLAAVSSVALAQPAGQLPPGHPPIGEQGSGSSPAAASPPAGGGGLPAGHPPMRDGAMPPTADELLKRLDAQPDLKTREKTFEVATSLGKLYYASARYRDAAEYLGQAWTKSEHARRLHVQQRKKAGASGTASASGCVAGREMQALAGEMEKRAAAGDAKGAVACGLVAMEQALEVGEMRANALALSGDLKGAVSGYAQVLDVDATREGSLYGHAAALLESRGDDVSALKMASVDLGALVAVAEPSPRADFLRRLSARVDQAIAAGGMSRLAAREEQERKAKGSPKMPPFAGGMTGGGAPPSSAPPAAPREPTSEQLRNMEEAARNMPRTPEVDQGLARLVDEAEAHLVGGRYQEALDGYKRVVPFQPENSRARAGMAWAMVQLNRQPMADRVWGVAVSSDPASLDKLGDILRQKGDEKGARGLWTKLKDSAPDYAAKSGLSKKLN